MSSCYGTSLLHTQQPARGTLLLPSSQQPTSTAVLQPSNNLIEQLL